MDMRRTEIERDEDWRDEIQQMPWLDFPESWQVQIIPPFGGALARFKVRRDDTPKGQCVSVYYDAHSRLGFMPYSYWEVYPCPSEDMERGECRRHRHDEVEGLMASIAESLDYLPNRPK